MAPIQPCTSWLCRYSKATGRPEQASVNPGPGLLKSAALRLCLARLPDEFEIVEFAQGFVVVDDRNRGDAVPLNHCRVDGELAHIVVALGFANRKRTVVAGDQRADQHFEAGSLAWNRTELLVELRAFWIRRLTQLGRMFGDEDERSHVVWVLSC